jgi:antitoxin VapB
MEAPVNAHDKLAVRKSARLFRNGRSQAVRIPKEFELPGKEVQITRLANGKLVIEPKAESKASPILAWLAENGPIEDFPTDPGEEGLLPLDDVEL